MRREGTRGKPERGAGRHRPAGELPGDRGTDQRRRRVDVPARPLDNQTRRLEAAARSALHPAARADAFRAVDAHSAFAAAHSAAGRHAAAAPHFRALGDRASEFPWCYLGSGDHEDEFERHRKIALAKG
ncbi:hypothetical protein [Streptomyces erythrochromogenes]|uniref:hypothetical protein n=1 Tax=Streptomyces erythrochromogenes TaxID=285574 RepID=UPI00367CC92A